MEAGEELVGGAASSEPACAMLSAHGRDASQQSRQDPPRPQAARRTQRPSSSTEALCREKRSALS